MQFNHIVGMLAGALMLSACGRPEIVTRSGGLVEDSGYTLATQGRDVALAADTATLMQPLYDVRDVSVIVPSDLRASEANVFYPLADIVWRGEPLGNRHDQVRQIFNEATTTATTPMTRGRPAVVEISVTRFHCVTEKTRYSVGGTHSMHFTLTVRDAQTGAVIDGPRPVVADTKAVGGSRALAEDAAGRTQRVVVLERLVTVLRRELSVPAQTQVTRADIAPATIAN
jgi:hypothetical protein